MNYSYILIKNEASLIGQEIFFRSSVNSCRSEAQLVSILCPVS